MKTITNYFISSSEKEIFISVTIFSIFLIGMCSIFNGNSQKFNSVKIDNFLHDQYGSFDQVHVSNTPRTISKMISVLKPGFRSVERNDVALKIHKALLKYNIEPQIIVAIIDTESNFNHEMVSETGDLSMAQLNVDIWNKEFERMKLSPIETDKLLEDKAYSLEVMAQILNILKMRYAKVDRRWYARYHSKTKKHKSIYLAKVSARLNLLEKNQVRN